jgi:uncharacterized damage-inducible protein DinB
MNTVATDGTPVVDSDLLVAHLEYAAWATQKTLKLVDQLPAGAITVPVKNSFPTLLATLQHVYGWDKYCIGHMQGGSIQREPKEEPQTYDELKRE